MEYAFMECYKHIEINQSVVHVYRNMTFLLCSWHEMLKAKLSSCEHGECSKKLTSKRNNLNNANLQRNYKSKAFKTFVSLVLLRYI